MKKNYTIPLHIKIFRVILRFGFRLVFHTLARVRIIGTENVPSHGPYLVAINHISVIEPPFVLSFWPDTPEAVGAKEIWERTGQSLLARMYGGIRVHRGEFDRDLVEKMLTALEAGHPLVIAPEGGRSHSTGMRRALPGVAYVMDRAQVPVIPVGIVGSTDDFLRKAFSGKRPPLEMRIGKPILLPPVTGKGEERHLSRQQNTDRIMYAIAALLPREYRGVYDQPASGTEECSSAA